MDFIIGGAYQGKLRYATDKYSLTEEDIFTCGESGEPDFGKRCIYQIERFTLWCADNAADAVDIFRRHKDEWENSVLICGDIFCGVVPTESRYRAWRETTGRLCAYLSLEAKTVTRIFCGLEQRLK